MPGSPQTRKRAPVLLIRPSMNEVIASLHNPRIKAVIRLRGRRGRKQTGEILIDGMRETGHALDAGVVVRELFFCRDLLERDAGGETERLDVGSQHREQAARLTIKPLLDRAQGANVRVTGVTSDVFSKIGYGQRSDGVVALAERPQRDINHLSIGKSALIAVVEGVEKPGNLGAILRNADAAAVDAVIAVDAATDIYGPNVIRSSVGTVFSLPLVETTSATSRAWLTQERFQLLAATPQGETAYTDVDYRGRTAIVLGAESRGLPEEWAGRDVIRAAVPMRGQSDSLNVSVTAALFFYEALRQRTKPDE